MNKRRAGTVQSGMLFLCAVLTLATPEAVAEDDTLVTGSYAVTLTEVQNSCTEPGLTLDKGTLNIMVDKSALRVQLDPLPPLAGHAEKGGKFHSNGSQEQSAQAGMASQLSLAGRVEKREVKFVLVVEFFRDKAHKEPSCTQSFQGRGKKAGAGT